MKDDKEVENVKEPEDDSGGFGRVATSPNFHPACEFNIAETNSSPITKNAVYKEAGRQSELREKRKMCI